MSTAHAFGKPRVGPAVFVTPVNPTQASKPKQAARDPLMTANTPGKGSFLHVYDLKNKTAGSTCLVQHVLTLPKKIYIYQKHYSALIIFLSLKLASEVRRPGDPYFARAYY